MFEKVLILAPHADDEVLGCGGTIARLIEDGSNIIVATMTNASVGAPELFSKSTIANVRKESLMAHKILGVQQSIYLDLPAPRLDQYPMYKIANEISALIHKHQPNSLFLPHRGDLHLDHGAIFNAAMVAARPQNSCPVKTIFSYETLSETDWAHPLVDTAFIPNTFISLSSANLQSNLKALAAFKSQMQEFPHSRSLKAIKALAQLRGATISCPAAEGFCNIRNIL